MKPNTQQDMTLTLTTKHCILFAALLLMAYPACAQHTATIDSLLAEARQKDQDIRSQTLQLMKRINQPPVSDSTLDSLTTLSLLQDSIDQANQQLVEQVLKNGLPEHLQPASYTTLWLIIDKVISQTGGLRFRPVTDQPLFYLALVAILVGFMLFLTGFLGELISRNSATRNEYKIKDTIE